MADHLDEWADAAHALSYLERTGSIPHRAEGEAALLEHLPAPPGRVLDVGTGDRPAAGPGPGRPTRVRGVALLAGRRPTAAGAAPRAGRVSVGGSS